MAHLRLAILQNIVLVPLAELGLRTAGLRRTWRILEAATGGASPLENPPMEDVLDNLAALKRAMAITPIKNKCLARSLVLWWQLERRGLHASLNIGIRKKQIFRAHAWLEYRGRPLNASKQVYGNYKSIGRFDYPRDVT
ncbi:lasso peptide biosynthesis B2 protein [Erythrobacter sp. F6033]|uniref:lasso peptide biosynthesis B2 protein n=1 Tax=Erythrobacter sp. F6033 TaxID=2926401 RepID=UPI001FF0E4FE|nr:lasso peptide biosynthesis B2 protein [Erythrobacter sp. F6033]MCK0127577.1 lasso peptide biosynthesis B2 protein [Erythrobacter sp. F6033]